MFIELVDHLRCVAPHEDTWLILAADRMEGRRVLDGTLGCPTCRASYPIRDGVAWLGLSPEARLPDDDRPAPEALEEEAVRLAALLDLREPGLRALVAGALGHAAAQVARMTEAELLLLDPPASVRGGEGVSILRTGGRVALAAGSMRAAALDERTAPLAAQVARVVSDRGRVVAPAWATLPPDVTELARDDRQWVAERQARISAPVQLSVVRGGKAR